MDSDLDNAPIAVNTTIGLTVLNDNDVAITSIRVTESTETAALGYNVRTSVPGSMGRQVYGTSHSMMDSMFSTRGGAQVELWGASFGKTADRLLREGTSSGAGSNPTTLAVTFGPSGTEFVATGCSVVEANTRIRCTVPEGYGSGHSWTVTVNGDQVATSI